MPYIHILSDPGMNYTLNRPLLDGTSAARIRKLARLGRRSKITKAGTLSGWASPLAHRVTPPNAVRSQVSIHMSEKFWSNLRDAKPSATVGQSLETLMGGSLRQSKHWG